MGVLLAACSLKRHVSDISRVSDIAFASFGSCFALIGALQPRRPACIAGRRTRFRVGIKGSGCCRCVVESRAGVCPVQEIRGRFTPQAPACVARFPAPTTRSTLCWGEGSPHFGSATARPRHSAARHWFASCSGDAGGFSFFVAFGVWCIQCGCDQKEHPRCDGSVTQLVPAGWDGLSPIAEER